MLNRVIVTGANGFLGFAVTKCLAEAGSEVIAIVREKAKHTESLLECNNTTIIECNLKDYGQLLQKIKSRGFDAFYHFAWEGSAGNLRSDTKVQLGNVSASIEALKVAEKLESKKFIFASSVMEYEVASLMSTTIEPSKNSIYCTSKIAANYMCRAVSSSLEIEYIAGIISNIYGPGEVSPRLINTTIRKLLNNEHVSLSTCNQLYDFLYIDDAAEMFKRIGEYGKNNHSYYIGNCDVYPLKWYMNKLRDIVDSNAELGFGEVPLNGVGLTYNEFDKSRLKTETGFEPHISFEEGINKTMEWIKSNQQKL